jgi:opacity protein-like surface antigen
MGANAMLKSMLLTGAVLGAAIAGPGAALAEGIFPSPTGWEGFYAGINGAYGQGTVSDGDTTFPDFDIAGGYIGTQAGYNFVLMDGVVVGLQGDIDWAGETGTIGEGTTTFGVFDDATLTDTLDWAGAFTTRLGFTAGPVMVYGLGGLAVASNTVHIVGVDQLGGASPMESEVTNTQYGWTAGAGISAMVGQISAFLEYRYSDYGTADYTPAVGDDPVELIDQQVRLGINYHMR